VGRAEEKVELGDQLAPVSVPNRCAHVALAIPVGE
jgi:hypothetical protein